MMDIVSARELANYLVNTSSEKLRKFASRENVSMSYSSIVACHSFFANQIKRLPLSGELMLLDSFVGSLRSDPFNYAPIGVNTDEKYIADALSDVISKYSQFYPKYQRPCTVGDILDLADAAIQFRKPRYFSDSETALFVERDDSAAKIKANLAGFVPEFSRDGICLARNIYATRRQRKPSLRSKCVVSIIYANDSTPSDALSEFIKSSRALKRSTASIYSRGNDILSKIIRISPSLNISVDLLPETSPEESVPMTSEESLYFKTAKAFFETSSFGEYALAVFIKKSRLPKISKEAKKLGLCVCNAIRVSRDPSFTLSASDGTKVSMRSNVFSVLSNPEAINVDIPKQIYSPEKTSAVTSLHASIDENTVIYSASTDLSGSDAPFADACRTVACAITNMVYDGFNYKNGEFHLSFKLSLPFKSGKDIGSSYAAVLGLYRGITEMGIPIENSYFSLDADSPSLSVSVRAHLIGSDAFLITEIPEKEFMESISDENGIPCFEDIKALMRGITE